MNKKTTKMEEHIEWILAITNCAEKMGMMK